MTYDRRLASGIETTANLRNDAPPVWCCRYAIVPLGQVGTFWYRALRRSGEKWIPPAALPACSGVCHPVPVRSVRYPLDGPAQFTAVGVHVALRWTHSTARGVKPV